MATLLHNLSQGKSVIGPSIISVFLEQLIEKLSYVNTRQVIFFVLEMTRCLICLQYPYYCTEIGWCGNRIHENVMCIRLKLLAFARGSSFQLRGLRVENVGHQLNNDEFVGSLERGSWPVPRLSSVHRCWHSSHSHVWWSCENCKPDRETSDLVVLSSTLNRVYAFSHGSWVMGTVLS